MTVAVEGAPAWRTLTVRSSSFASVAIAVLVPVALLVWWWQAAKTALPVDLPAPVDVVSRAGDLLYGVDAHHTWTSMLRILIAVGLALIIGATLVFISRVIPATRVLIGSGLLTVLNGVPALGWAILGVVWFGVGNTSVVFVVTLIIVPFCMVNLLEGMRSLDPGLLEMGRSFSRSQSKLIFKVQLPLLLPYVLAAIRLSFSVGWKVALIAEFFGAEAGLGLVMNRARQSFDTTTVFATVLTVVLIVIVAERLLFDPLSRMTARRSGSAGTT